MTNFNLVVVENGTEICLTNDATNIEVKNDKLVFVCDDGGSEDSYSLDRTDEIIIQINR